MNKTVIRIRELLFYFLIPLVKIVGKISLPFAKKDPMINFYKIKKILKPMDIILTTSYGHLSNLFNPGKFKHALAYLGEEKGIPVIIESIGEGVVKKTLVECLSTKDFVAVIRPKKNVISNPRQADKAIRWLKSQEGKPYDFVFDMNSQKRFKNFFCSELIYFSIKHVNPETEFVLRKTFGVPTVTPSDFYRADKKFKLIYETKKNK